MRFTTLFIIAGASYEILVKAGTLLTVPFTPGPAGAGTIGMIIGVMGENAFEWFMVHILKRERGKFPTEPSYVSEPVPEHDELEDLARKIEPSEKGPRK